MRRFTGLPRGAVAGQSALALLATVLLGTPGVPARLLAHTLVRAAVRRTSLFDAALGLATVGVEAVRRVLRANLARWTEDHWSPETLLRHAPLTRGQRRRRHIVTIDWHDRPYYGAKATRGTRGGQAKASTNRFYTYATAAIRDGHQTLTLAVEPVPTGVTPAASVAVLLDRLQAYGLRIKLVLLDRGFYSAATIADLHRRRLPFLMPVIRRGRTADETGTLPLFRRAEGYTTYTWTPRHRGPDGHRRGAPMTATIAVVARPGRTTPWVYATDSDHRPLPRVAELYRLRFGIETTYKLLHRVEARTTAKDPVWRLVLIVIGLLLVTLWARGVPATPARRAEWYATHAWQTFCADLHQTLDATPAPNPA